MNMKNIFTLSLAGFLGLALITSCGGGKSGSEASADTTQVAATQPGAPSAEQMALGKAIFETPGKCITCHQANGQGVANVFPNLVGSKFLLEQKTLAVSQVLNGSAFIGNKTVKYPAPMPPQVSTKDSAVAVINYVLNSFGNTGGVVTEEDVKDVVIEPRK
jgi:nitrite reductase (NO-forming)